MFGKVHSKAVEPSTSQDSYFLKDVHDQGYVGNHIEKAVVVWESSPAQNVQKDTDEIDKSASLQLSWRSKSEKANNESEKAENLQDFFHDLYFLVGGFYIDKHIWK